MPTGATRRSISATSSPPASPTRCRRWAGDGSATAGRSTRSPRSRAARRYHHPPKPRQRPPGPPRTHASGTGVRSDRPNLIGDPYANVVQPVSSATIPLSLQYFNPAAFAQPAAGTFGNLARNALYGPGFRSVDLSVFKTTKLSGNASVQLRLEMFNVFNTVNWANPGASVAASTSFGVITNTRNANNAPGIGAGEPRNAQLAVKFIF